jgi:hypothetical protein
MGQVSTANTNRDGSGTLATLGTAPAAGSRLDGVIIQGVGTTTAGMVRLYIHDGANARLFAEVPITAITPSATQPAFSAALNSATMAQAFPIVLPSGYSLRASTHNAETFNVIGQAGDLT